MTAVPKPLKFLRPHYEALEKTYQSWPDGDNKNSLADVLSVMGMTHSDEERRESLKYRLLAPSTELASWGHEYVRHLALEIGSEYQDRMEKEQEYQDLFDLSETIVPFYLKHNAEADAVDLLTELEAIENITKFVDENTYERTCLYMVRSVLCKVRCQTFAANVHLSMVPLLTFPDNDTFLKTAHEIYKRYGKLTQAMTLAIRLNDLELIKSDLFST